MKKDLLSITNMSIEEINDVLDLGKAVKKDKAKYAGGASDWAAATNARMNAWGINTYAAWCSNPPTGRSFP